MKKQVSPAVFIIVIVAIVLVIGGFMFRQATVNSATPRPNPKFFGGGASSSGSSATQPGH